MKRLERLLLIAIAFVVGGWLGYKLLPAFEIANQLMERELERWITS